MSLRRCFALLLLVASASMPASVLAKPPEREPAPVSAKTRARHDDAGAKSKKRKGALSIGSPNRGRLERGVRLKPSAHLKIREGARTWGLPQLVKALHRAADRVASKFPHSVLLVGDLSGRRGGKIEGHNSHQSGRDADIGFYATNSKGRPVALSRFVAFDGDGKSKDWARFDDARNWMLVDELLKDPKAGVRHVFVSSALRARLLKYAASKKVSKEAIARAAAAMVSPEGVDVHDDHFHVRIACPESMRDVCVEESAPHDRDKPADETAAGPTSTEASVETKSAEPEPAKEAREGRADPPPY